MSGLDPALGDEPPGPSPVRVSQVHDSEDKLLRNDRIHEGTFVRDSGSDSSPVTCREDRGPILVHNAGTSKENGATHGRDRRPLSPALSVSTRMNGQYAGNWQKPSCERESLIY